jgi:phosphoribosyl-ATP pyrophosphohydrolase/phosphoribosyl-AMP cyclohydrolase
MNNIINKLKFNENGLIVATAQDYKTNEVLMQAWMNKESIEVSIKTGFATYFSRSRGQLWKKGETSGNLQELVEIIADCDFDSLLIKVKQQGNACHTGARNCFFNKLHP